MSRRLNQEREAELTPQRVEYALSQLKKLEGVSDIQARNDDCITFIYKKYQITFWAYSGWFSGKGLIAGRGIQNLIDQLK